MSVGQETGTLRRKPKLALIDPNLKTAHGHYLGYARRVAEGAATFGVETLIVANHVAADPGVLPLLERDYWQEMRPAEGTNPHDHLAGSARLFSAALHTLIKSYDLTADDVVFLPYVNLAETLGLARLVREAGHSLPRLVLLFRRNVNEQAEDACLPIRHATSLLAYTLGDLADRLSSHKLCLCTDSEELSAEHESATGCTFETFPIPVDPRICHRPIDAPEHPTLLYLGDARTEKGYDLLPVAAQAVYETYGPLGPRIVIQSNFNVPGGEAGIADARHSLADLSTVQLLDAPLSEEEYLSHLASADLMLLPYRPERYIARTSGILAEAISAGIPAVVPEGTWLSSTMTRFGAGVTFDGSAEAFREAVLAAVDELAALRRCARKRRDAFAAFHNPNQLAALVCDEAVLERGRAHTLWRRALAPPRVNTEHLIATASPDHLEPHGTARDNSRNPAFNRKLRGLWRPGTQLRILDLGCSGGGFVRSCVEDGYDAIGLEGSDYSLRLRRAEWNTIPDRLFTCDISRPFTITPGVITDSHTGKARFDVVTAWEVVEHLSEDELRVLCENVRRHLSPGGAWIMSVSPLPEVVRGTVLHQTVQSREWWLRFFATEGFVNNQDIVDYFDSDWVRGPLQGAPCSFHFVLSRPGEPCAFASPAHGSAVTYAELSRM